MEQALDLREYSSTMAEVVARLQSIIRDAEDDRMSVDLRLMRVSEHANVALEFMQSIQQALGTDETGQA
jgi:hypothetical protein